MRLAQILLAAFLGHGLNRAPPPRPEFGSSRAKRVAKKRAEGLRLTVINGRIGFGERVKLVGGKGLCP